MVGEWLFYFFFQAEDGIRDRTVTGVQTCALPIWELPDPRLRLPLHGRGTRRAREREGRGEARGPRTPPLRMCDGRCLRIGAMRLRSATRCRDEATRARLARHPVVPRPGGTGHRDRQQGRGVPPPGPRPRHGRCESGPRVPRGSPELQVCRVHAPRPRGHVNPVDDEQPREDRGAPRVRRPRDETDPPADPGHGYERPLPAIEEGAAPASPHDADDPRSSIDATTRSAVTISPSATATSRTTPSPGDGISFCIFIASRTTSVWPRST